MPADDLPPFVHQLNVSTTVCPSKLSAKLQGVLVAIGYADEIMGR